ncbi:septum site-determining protein MinC [Butyrivibrio sp. MC2013]|uniref:septum site-determining protein MinC n=1 Tax=Butyrivibrio sp. MC2013 TaxID=1280686 RepID=UPI000404B32B|nr:septum site-determining protein MinC [Butyrivibrio sp. MC2013]
MAQPVSIKGTKNGIILVLDKDIPYEELRRDIASKFAEAASFLGKNKMGLMVRGRRLNDAEQEDLLEIIKGNSDLDIVCILDEDHPLDNAFVKAVRSTPHHVETVQPQALRPTELTPEEKNKLLSEAYTDAYEAAFQQLGDANARIHVGNLRSGQEIVSEHSLVIFGDVNPGGSVISAGSIFVFGALHGTAFAGATGDANAFVMAMDFNPLQVRISDAIAVSDDKKTVKESGGLLSRRRKKAVAGGPEVAYTYQGAIARSAYDRQFLMSNKFFK